MERKMDIAVCQAFMDQALDHKPTKATIMKMLALADKNPMGELVTQSHIVYEEAKYGGVSWDSYWGGVIHGVTLAACSGDPKFLEGIKNEMKGKETIQ